MKRLLLLAPVVEPQFVGGLQLALLDLVTQLQQLDWDVEARIYQENDTPLAPSVPPTPAWIAAVQRSPLLLRWRQRIPAGLRLTLSALFQNHHAAIQNLRWAESRLTDPARYDAILVCLDTNVRGMLALALARHPRVAVLSLAALAEELRPSWWWLPRCRPLHPFHYRPANAAQIRCAIFASDRWRADAIHAGLSPQAAHTIYFGIPLPPLPHRPPAANQQRLLWVGRLTPEKGLHLLLAALPLLRQRFPQLTLTAIAAQGEPTYRRLIDDLIATANLADAVSLRPPVPRAQLPALYAQHDALFFYSINPEPVALVLMEAYAHGLPVAANHADSPLVQDGVTCLTYHPTRPHSLVESLTRLLSSPEITTTLAARARREVEQHYSLEAMGHHYNRLLG